ncbi:MAG: 16S rRNA (cytidine(1402)-2'-O)-methyltransferase [Acidobacteria bacterium]|nr:16S rRNA (cytidine(1402)-2'-O)-methyltransferase [Acidobacteriota bacterium]
MSSTGTLYIVATPIGNLEDITFRAVRVLKGAAVIACEDTRHTRKLTEHFGISAQLVSYHEHNERDRTAALLTRIEAGESVALVSDAGTPLISDPGFRLVEQAAARGIPVVPIPGASAALAALSAAGLATGTFRFVGFPSPKASGRRRQMEDWKVSRDTTILYEAPHRILATLEELNGVLGPCRRIVLARELTKLHEEFLRGTVAEVRETLARQPAVKGEITLLIAPAPDEAPPAGPQDLPAEVAALVAAGVPRMDAIKQVAHRHGLGKRDVYRLLESGR